MINNLTPYRLPTKYERLKQQAFNLVKEKVIKEINDDVHLQHLGVKVNQLDVEKYTYLIEYLLYARIQADTFVQSQGGCITEQDVDEIKEEYLIDCILKEGVCEGFTRDLIDFMFKFPLCTDTVIYEWLNPSSNCTTIEGINYLISTRVVQKRSGIVLQVVDVPTNYTFNQFKFLFPDATQQDFDARYIKDVNETCCFNATPTATTISVLNATNTSINIAWTDIADSYQLIVKDSNDIIVLNIILTETEYNITELTVNSQYSIEIISTNCAGNSSSIITASTLPYTLTINVCAELTNQLTFTNYPLGENQILEFGNPISIDFVDLTAPYYQVDSVLINNNENINNVIFNAFQDTVPTGGIITIPVMDRNYTVEICGALANLCATVNVSYDDSSSTLIIN